MKKTDGVAELRSKSLDDRTERVQTVVKWSLSNVATVNSNVKRLFIRTHASI